MDVNQSRGRVKSSDLVQNGRNYSPDVVGGLYWVGPGAINHGHITLGRPPKTRFRAFLDVNQSLVRVERSDLVQIGRSTSPGVVGAL